MARTRRRRGRTERRLIRQSATRNQARGRRRKIVVATYNNVETTTMDRTHGVRRALDMLSVYDRLGCDIIGPQETRRSEHSDFTQAGYLIYCTKLGGENGRDK